MCEKRVCTDSISRKCFVPDNNNAKSGKFSDLNELSGFASVSDTLLLQTCAGSCCHPRSAIVEASGGEQWESRS